MFNPNEYVALVPKMNMGVMVDVAEKRDDYNGIDVTHHIIPLKEASDFIKNFQQPREFFTTDTDKELRKWLDEQGLPYSKPEELD